ncbi:phosphate acetyltransferase [Pseudarthrobacter cellobiosi]|uniref:phosphate acetyltransferase n=1 Tax=Pseudarthrobacter cellobiosi TaxID=2953654 RepID=UPI00208F0270|nr:MULTISPECIES: phosphate acetyltransferase [unclassified Pseudarthrobacter]MCO4253911.1 phosphate acetyltransferase [Pseudarthrobacter sp. HLT1-5]MCO4276629.1 phosphate acetyltransferase [Pseudarthrobacter sp. HLT3-5]
MAKGIYVSATTPGSGKSLVALGLADTLHRHADRIGFFKPVVHGPDAANDPMVALMKSRFALDDDRCRGGLTSTEVRALLADGKRADIDARCVEIFAEIAKHCDVVIVEGTDLTGQDAAVEFDLNARLANNLAAPVVAVVGAKGLSVAEAAAAVEVARKELVAEKCTLLAIMVNRADPDLVEEIAAAIKPGASNRPVYVLPELEEIARPTTGEVATALGVRQIAGLADMERDVRDIKVAAMNVGNFLNVLDEGALVIVPGDRADVMVACLASSFSPEFPVPSALILTGGLSPDANIYPLLAQAPFPVFAASEDTYTTAKRVSEVRSEIWSGHRRKVASALGLWSKRVDEAELVERLHLPRLERMTPLRFLHDLIERARGQRRHVVLPEGTDVRILQAAEILHRRDVCDLTLLGPDSQVRELAAANGIDLAGINIVDPATSELRQGFAEKYAELRAHKGVDLPKALEIMQDGSYFGTMMVQLGVVDGMVSGAAHTTAHTIRPALEFVKTRDGVKIVSSVFLMLMPDRVLVYGDCAVNPDPNVEQLADIALASAETAVQFGVEPRVAMLSYSTGGSGSGEAVDEVRLATELVRRRRPDLAVEGPIQYDAAVDASIAESKMPGSSVAGQATVFIFPDLNTGNNTYKAVQQSSGAVAVGPVLQGLRKPVNDLSRGCTVEDIVNTVAITAIQAQVPSPAAV